MGFTLAVSVPRRECLPHTLRFPLLCSSSVPDAPGLPVPLNLEFPAPNSMSADAGLRSMLTNPFAQTGKYIRFFSLRQLNEFAAVWEKQSPTIQQAIQDKVGEFGDPSSFFFTFPLLPLRNDVGGRAAWIGTDPPNSAVAGIGTAQPRGSSPPRLASVPM
jgi:hypothetical protein